jgi:hypothetical protein
MANRELRASVRDGELLGRIVLWTRSLALKEPVGSPRRRLWVGLNRGYVNGISTWSFLKSRRLRDLPDEAGDDGDYSTGLAAGDFLATVMCALAASLRHADLSDPGSLVHFALHYGQSITMKVVTGDATGSSVLQWIRDSETLFRAHAAAAYDAESHCYGVGEVIELEFLRALAKRTGVAMPSDAETRIAERRRDAKNLPTGVNWSQLPEPAAVGGPLDGAGDISAEAAKELRDRVRQAERAVILDSQGDGAWGHRGILAGLTATDRVPLLPSQGTDPTFHRGCLGGSLAATLIRSRGEIDIDLMRAAYVYARVLASQQAQALLSEPLPDGLLKADALARYLVRRQVADLHDADALAFFNWLAGQMEVAVTPALLERREHFVARSVRQEPKDPPDRGPEATE